MPQNQCTAQESVAYFFNKSKDVYEENEVSFITVFARLTREFTYANGVDTYKKAETIWVGIEDIKVEEASEKLKSLPNGMQRYTISENVFRDLYQLSKNCSQELYCVTPFHRASTQQKYV